jgi:8-amino-7-oxononanoate synthase
MRQVVDEVSGPFVSIQGRWVLNFAGTNYLGLGRHPALQRAMVDSIGRVGVSLSMPRVLATDPATRRLEQGLAKLVGQEQALVFPSTTHAVLDVLPFLAGAAGVLFLDAWTYPISVQAAALAQRGGARVCVFAHNDVKALGRLLAKHGAAANKVIVCDGVYSAGGGQARLREFARLAQMYGATVVVDDAHGLGVLGKDPSAAAPYGHGGGGVLLHQAAPASHVIYVGSLSKAFSVPLAFAAGPERLMAALGKAAGAHIHSSPPALPIVAAAGAALQLNRVCGDWLRDRLLARVRQFRRGFAEQGLVLSPQMDFPIQSLRVAEPAAAIDTARALRRQGIWAVVQIGPADYAGGAVLRFLLTAQHTPATVAMTARAVAAAMERHRRKFHPSYSVEGA